MENKVLKLGGELPPLRLILSQDNIPIIKAITQNISLRGGAPGPRS